MKKLTIILLTVILSGCAASNGDITGVDPDTPSSVMDNTGKKFVGIPVLLSMEGSYARLNDEWIITAAHNRPILPQKTFYHPTCDVALYKNDNAAESVLDAGVVYYGEEVFHVGYPLLYGEVSQKGVVVGDTIDDEGCRYTITTAVMRGGMSGGGVYNSKGHLIGINNGISEKLVWEDGRVMDNMTLFITINAVKGWIKEVTGGEVLPSE